MNEIRLLDSKIDSVCQRIGQLFDGLTVCTDPVLRWNLQTSIEILSEELTKLSNERNLKVTV